MKRSDHGRGVGRLDRTPWIAAAVMAAGVFTLYVVTLAPTTQFWDASEYIATAHVLGIPHPPGNPLFVLVSRVWAWLLAPLALPVAVRVNLLSAAASALAHFFWFLVLHRALRQGGDRGIALIGAVAGTVLSATAFTVWNQSNVNEKVYTLSLLTIALCSWLLMQWRARLPSGRNGEAGKWLVLAVYVVALSATNHLMGLLVVPAMLVFVLAVQPRVLVNGRLWAAVLAVAVIGASVFAFLPIRALLDPLINEGDPSTWPAFLDTLTRKQYAKPSVLTSPLVPGLPRDGSLIAAQLANWLQYFDWQWARSIGGEVSWFGGARPLVTVVALALGLLGARAHWLRDRASALFMAVLFATLSIGLTLYLNFKYGYSAPMAESVFAVVDPREVRERDYFFLAGFSVWGLWMGVGVAALWRLVFERVTRALSARRRAGVNGALTARIPRFAAAPVLGLALVPLALNWSWATRAGDYTARDFAHNTLMSVEPYGVLFTNGDNDTFPLWYAQEVEGIRRDVTVIVRSYLGAPWYAKQVRDLSRACAAGLDPRAQPTRIVCQRPYDASAAPYAAPVRPPGDSVLPLSDEEIERIASTAIRLDRPATFRTGDIDVTIPAGTVLAPSDTFITAVLAANAGARPVHFVIPSEAVTTLGLGTHVVRAGLTFRLHDRVESPASRPGVVALRTASPEVFGAWIDVATSADLLERVFEYHGAPARPAVWADSATKGVPLYYAWAHAAVGQALAAQGDGSRAERFFQRADAWLARAQ